MWLIYADLSSVALLFCVLYIPGLQHPFHVVNMGLEDWILMAPISLSGFVAIEIVKLVYRRVKKSARA
jgi:hypothetical protein